LAAARAAAGWCAANSHCPQAPSACASQTEPSCRHIASPHTCASDAYERAWAALTPRLFLYRHPTASAITRALALRTAGARNVNKGMAGDTSCKSVGRGVAAKTGEGQAACLAGSSQERWSGVAELPCWGHRSVLRKQRCSGRNRWKKVVC
jgi:hypothetical protein